MRYSFLAVFDMDGTLVDSITDVGLCFNSVLEEFALPTHELAKFGRFVGGDLEQVVSKMLPPNKREDRELIKAIGTRYRAVYSASDKPNTKPFDGIAELLTFLKANNCAVAVNTNKNQLLAEDVAAKLFPEFKFDYILGSGGKIAPKPDREGVDVIAGALGVSLENACYIGDTLSDVLTAKNAEIPCFYVTWGQGGAGDREAYDRLLPVDSVDELRARLAEFIEVRV